MGSRKRTHFIMRHFQGEQEIFSWRTLPPFDAFIVNIKYDQAAYIAEIARMVEAGKKYFRYYSGLEYPYCGDNFGGVGGPSPATWYNWQRDNVQFNGSASFKRLRVSNTVGLFFAYLANGERRELIPWKDVTGSLMQSMAQKMVDLAGAPGGVTIPCSGIFLDQSWLSHFDWMYGFNNLSGHGDTKESDPGFPPLSTSNAAANYAISAPVFGTPDLGTPTWGDHTAAYAGFVSYLQARLAALNPSAIVLANGEHNTVNSTTMPKPWCMENAWNNLSDGGSQPARWAAAQTHWLSDRRNLLSLQAFDTANGVTGFPEAFALWKANGGWFSITDDGTPAGIINREMAYMDAAMIQGGHY